MWQIKLHQRKRSRRAKSWFSAFIVLETDQSATQHFTVIKTVIVENVFAVKYRTAYRQTFQTLLPVVTNSLYVYATYMNLPSKWPVFSHAASRILHAAMHRFLIIASQIELNLSEHRLAVHEPVSSWPVVLLTELHQTCLEFSSCSDSFSHLLYFQNITFRLFPC